jgi:hypothetical protein
MNSLFVKLAAVASSFVLALPPGWCSGLMQHDQAKPAPAKAVCCHEDNPCDSQEAPAEPTIECCCSWEATVPEKSGQLTDAASLGLPLVVAGFTPDLDWLASESVIAPFHSGPRLHVLQCVWRC